MKLGESSPQEANENSRSDLKWKNQIKVSSIITRRTFHIKFG